MIKIGIIIGSDRDARVASQVAEHFYNRAVEMNITDAEFEIVDIKDYDLPPFNEDMAPMMLEEYSTQAVKDWSAKIAELDGYIFVTPEYNKSIPASLKLALEHLAGEWANKVAGIVSYGSTLGVTATQALRIILSNLKVATVTPFGAFNLFTDFENMQTFKPAAVHAANTDAVINDTVAWAKGLKTIR